MKKASNKSYNNELKAILGTTVFSVIAFTISFALYRSFWSLLGLLFLIVGLLILGLSIFSSIETIKKAKKIGFSKSVPILIVIIPMFIFIIIASVYNKNNPTYEYTKTFEDRIEDHNKAEKIRQEWKKGKVAAENQRQLNELKKELDN